MRLLLPLLLLSLLLAAGRAELSPMLYLCWARSAPEALYLQPERVDRESIAEFPDQWLERVTLRVIAVRRSASGVQAGDRIRIEQLVAKKPRAQPRRQLPGPAPLPDLRLGESVPAFLERDAKDPQHFHPAAQGHTFSPDLWKDEADPAKVAERSC